MARGWLTPDFPPEHRFYTRRLQIPATAEFLGLVNGALIELCLPHNWEQSGGMTPFETADYFTQMWQSYTHNENEPPDWEAPDDLDGQPEQVWYEDLADWIIQGFLAITFTPAAAVVYQATVPQLRVAIRTGNLGALFRVLINGVEVWSGDSYTPLTDLLEQVFDMSTETEPYTVRIEHNGVGPNINGTEAKLEVIRGKAVADMVATILRADPEGCGVQWSTDGGDTWDTVDLATCITGLANDAIIQAVNSGYLQRAGGQPGPSNPPPQGECLSFHVKLAPGAQWLCPNPVSAGFTVEVTNMSGGWSIGELAWYCPDGSRFLLGSCSEENRTHVSGDLLNPGAYHMALVGLVDGVYFALSTGDMYTVPTGVASEELRIMANTGLTGAPSGDVEFDVTVCSSASEFTHRFDFDVDDGGWTVGSGQGGLYGGVEPAHWGGTQVGSNKVCGIEHTFSNRTIGIVSVSPIVELALAGEPIIILYRNNTQVARFDGTTADNASMSGTYSHDFAGVDADKVLVQIAAHGNTTICNIYSIEVSGLGSDPFTA